MAMDMVAHREDPRDSKKGRPNSFVVLIVGLLTLFCVIAWLCLSFLDAHSLDSLLRSFLPRPLRAHELERLSRYLSSGGALCIGVPVVLWLGLLAQRQQEFLSLIVARAARWRWTSATIIGVIATFWLRGADHYEWYLLSFMCFVFRFGFVCMLTGGLCRARRYSTRLGNADIQTISTMLLGACLIFVAAGVSTALGLRIVTIAYWLLLPSITLILVYRICGEIAARHPNVHSEFSRRIGLWRYPLLLVAINGIYTYVLYAFMLAPPDVDICSQAQLAAWMKSGASSSAVQPYAGDTSLSIKYPPALYSVTAIASQLLNGEINFMLLWLWAISLQVLILAVYVLLVALVKHRWIACCASLLFGGSESLHLFNGGQVQELYAIAFAALLFRLTLGKCLSLRNAILAGMLLAGAMLSQTEVAFPLLIALPLYWLLLALRAGFRGRRTVLTELGHYTIMGITTLTLTAPWLGRLWEYDLSPGLAPFHWTYSLISGVFWGTKGVLYGIVVGIGLGAAAFFSNHRSKILLLLISAILLSQYHYIYAAFNVPGYSVRDISGSVFGAKQAFTDPYFPFISQWGVIWLDFIVILGVISSYSVVAAHRLFVHLRFSKQRTRAVLLVACLIGATTFRLGVRPFSSVIHLYDYQALRWLKSNSEARGTMVWNPTFDVPGTNAMYGSWWAGAVGERRVTFARITEHEVAIQRGQLEMTMTPTLLNMSQERIDALFAPRRITHVFVSSRHDKNVDEWVYNLIERGYRLLHENKGAMILETPYD